MPGPGPLALAVPGAMAGAKRLALQASTYLYTSEAAAFTSATCFALLANWLWKRLPIWIKEDISFQALMQQQQQDKDDCNQQSQPQRRGAELTHLASVLQGFNRMAKSIEKIYEVPQIYAAICAFGTWSGEFKEAQMASNGKIEREYTRDYLYQTAGPSFSMEQLQSKEYQEPLEFATWAYHKDTQRLRDKLHDRGYELQVHNKSKRPGNVAYYVALHHHERRICVGVRGTSTLEDLVTDCCGHAVPLHLEREEEYGRVEVEAEKPNEILICCMDDNDVVDDHDVILVQQCTTTTEHSGVEVISGHERIRCETDDLEGDNHVRCHEGILVSAQRMTQKIQSWIKKWALDAGYDIMLCGHSLGAGAAILSAVILRSQYPELRDKIQVYAFAPPPVLDHDSALAAGSFVTSIVYNADMIPRCSLYNLAIVVKILRRVHARLEEMDLNPTGPTNTAAFIRYLYYNKRGGGTGNTNATTEDDWLLTPKEWSDSIRKEAPNIRMPDHLFVPGRVLLVYNPWEEQQQQKQEEGKTTNNHDDDPQQQGAELKPTTWHCIETNGAAQVLTTLEVDGMRSMTDHVSSSYYEALGMEYHF